MTGAGRAPKPNSLRPTHNSKKDKLKYLSSQYSPKGGHVGRNFHQKGLQSVSSNYEQKLMSSTQDEDPDPSNLDIEKIDSVDSVSQYSLQMPKGGAKENFRIDRSHSNSFASSKNNQSNVLSK